MRSGVGIMDNYLAYISVTITSISIYQQHYTTTKPSFSLFSLSFLERERKERDHGEKERERERMVRYGGKKKTPPSVCI